MANFEYTPFPIVGDTLDEKVYEAFLRQRPIPAQINALVISPVSDAILSKGGFSKEGINIGIKTSNPSTEWVQVYHHLLYYLSIREEDSRELAKTGRRKFFDLLTKREGMGYMIKIEALLDEIDNLIDNAIDYNVGKEPDWPRKKPTEDTMFSASRNDYSKLSTESVQAALQARNFIAGFENRVIESYKEANKKWFRAQTGYDNKRIPLPEKGYIVEERQVGTAGLITIRLIRQERRSYQGIIEGVQDDLRELQRGEREEIGKIYRPDNGSVNIKRVKDRLAALSNDPEFVSPYARFEITPS